MKGKDQEDNPPASGLESMKLERLRSVFFALLTGILLPLVASGGQESPSGETDEKLSEVETPDEKREGLDRELDSSLSEFDALILKEQEILEQRREAAAAAGGGGGAGKAEAGAGAGEGEGEGETEGKGEGEAGDEQARSTAEGTGGSPDEPSGEEVDSDAGDPASADEEAGEVSNGRVPPDVGDGSDDDIVARQLREAAMKEEDPELREKLWDEYRAYKFGQKKETEG
jgi:hypothetical protein